MFKIIEECFDNDLEKHVINVYMRVQNDPKLLRRLYVSHKILFKADEFKLLIELNQFAPFDEDHEDAGVAKSAKRVIERFKFMKGHDHFKAAMEKDRIAGFYTDDMLYVATLSVKPGDKKYQMTEFLRDYGPTGDGERNSIDDFLEVGYGIPISAVFADKQKLLDIQHQYMKKF